MIARPAISSRRLLRPVAMAVLALGLVACGNGAAEESPAAASPQTAVTTSASAAPTATATAAANANANANAAPKQLRFVSETVEGQPFEGTSLAGRDVVVWFWAPWCTECRREAPHVAAVQAATGSAVTFLGAAGLGEVSAMRAFIEDYGVEGFEHIADTNGKVWQGFGIVRQPAYAFIDDSGAVKVIRGELGEERLAAEVARLTAD